MRTMRPRAAARSRRGDPGPCGPAVYPGRVGIAGLGKPTSSRTGALTAYAGMLPGRGTALRAPARPAARPASSRGRDAAADRSRSGSQGAAPMSDLRLDEGGTQMNDQEAIYQLHETRIFGATPAAVYRAFVDPRLLAAWYPRAGWSMPPQDIEIDPRPGGRLRYVLVSTRDPARRAVRSAEFSDAQEGSFLAWTKEPSSGGAAGEGAPARRVQV